MRGELIILATSMLTCLLILNVASAEDISSTSHEITITTGEKDISVKETIIITGSSNGKIGLLNFWIQDGASDINLFVKGTSVLFNETSDNLYLSNISSLELDMDSQPKIEINYKIDKNSARFQKKLIRNMQV